MRRGPGDMGANVGNKDFGPTGKSGGNVGGSDADEIGDALAESKAAGFTGGGKDDGPSYQEVQAAIKAARKSGKSLGVFTPDDYRDGILQDQKGILGLIGYDDKKSFFDNVIDIVVPGRNTPLGAGTAFVKGLSIPQQLALGIANTVIGRQMNAPKTPTETALSDSIIGKDSIVGELGNMPQTGIASGRQTPATGYTGRPDDAPASVKGNINTLEQQAIDAVKDMINQQSQSNLSTPKNTLDQARVMDALTKGTGTPLSDPVTQIADSGYLSQIETGLKNLADNIVEIPGGYMDTKTGLTFSGDYQRRAPARTVTGRRKQDVSPFTLESFMQNLGVGS